MISKALAVAPAQFGTGGLGTAVAEFVDGLSALGISTSYVGSQDAGFVTRLAGGRGFRRVFGSGPHRRAEARAVRAAAPPGDWDLVYAVAGSVPVGVHTGLRVIHQSTRHPLLERAALRRAERETGGRGDLSRAECKRREHEILNADLIHVTTLAVRDEFLAAGVPHERLVHSYLGVDLRRFRPARKPDDLRIAFVGPLSLRKGVDTVAQLAVALRGSASVMTVGGPTCPWSRRIVSNAPFLAQPSVPEVLSQAHILVLPSRSDAFAYVVLEALASGTIPVVTPEVGAAEIVRTLDDRLILERRDFVDGLTQLIPQLDFVALSERAIALAARFDRRVTGRHAAHAILEAGRRLNA